MTFKQKVYQAYHQSITHKIAALHQSLEDLNESSRNETKSSAGDKYETTREMLQLEKDKVAAQLNEAHQQKALLEQLANIPSSNAIQRGSLVQTNKGYLFISLAMGKIVVDYTTVMSLSPQSPLGNKLMGLQINDSVEMNGTKYLIQSVE